jgi:type 1 glutamine amidotransferase
MKLQLISAALVLIAPFALLATPERSDDPASYPTKKVLFFSKSSGYEHVVIRDTSVTDRPMNKSQGNAEPGLAFKVLKELGAKDNIEFVYSKDGSLFTPEYLAQFDAYYFFTTGDLTKAGVDGNPPMTQAGKQALLQAVAAGKGFIGSHCASDTFHSPGGDDQKGSRFRNDGDNADPYVKMLGGEFVKHGDQQLSHLIVVDPRFPGIIAVPADNRFTEEWYTLKNFAADLHVLMVQDTSGMAGIDYARPNYPSTWAHMYGKGRVFYTSLGHRDDIWKSDLFQAVVVGGLNWAVGRVDADVTPNMNGVAPHADVLPVRPAVDAATK